MARDDWKGEKRLVSGGPEDAPLPCEFCRLRQIDLEPNIVFGLMMLRKTTYMQAWVRTPNLPAYMFETA